VSGDVKQLLVRLGLLLLLLVMFHATGLAELVTGALGVAGRTRFLCILMGRGYVVPPGIDRRLGIDYGANAGGARTDGANGTGRDDTTRNTSCISHRRREPSTVSLR